MSLNLLLVEKDNVDQRFISKISLKLKGLYFGAIFAAITQ